jgi:hypothetical protein
MSGLAGMKAQYALQKSATGLTEWTGLATQDTWLPILFILSNLSGSARRRQFVGTGS